jgi:hypothetical protein
MHAEIQVSLAEAGEIIARVKGSYIERKISSKSAHQ